MVDFCTKSEGSKKVGQIQRAPMTGFFGLIESGTD